MNMTKNLYVGNLPFNTTADDLRDAFAQYGTVARAQVVSDRETGRSRGFGFVEMENGGEAAIDGLNGSDFGGRSLTVNEARPREPRAQQLLIDTHGSERSPPATKATTLPGRPPIDRDFFAPASNSFRRRISSAVLTHSRARSAPAVRHRRSTGSPRARGPYDARPGRGRNTRTVRGAPESRAASN